MCRRLFGLAALLGLIVIVGQAAEENPLKNAKVGDFVSYKVTTNMGATAMQMEMKQTVVNKTETEVTMEVATKVMGQEMKQTHTFKLNEKYDPRAPMQGKGDATFKELDKGEETITVGGKTMKTSWTSFETSYSAGANKVTTKGKAWVCPDVPLGGMVKTEMDMGAMGKSNMELVDFGRGK